MARIIPTRAPDLPGSNTRPHCRLCSHVNGYLGRYVKSNGHIAIRWVCDNCEDYRTASDLPHSILPEGITTADLPLRVDHSDYDNGLPECAAWPHELAA